MKKVEMSVAGLTLLLHRAESALSLWEIVRGGTGEPPNAHERDLAEASREARDRLGLPPREPWKPATRPEAPTRKGVNAMRAESKAMLEQIIAIENRYPGGEITDPADKAEVERLVPLVLDLEKQIEAEEERWSGRIIACGFERGPDGKLRSFPVSGERVLIDPRDDRETLIF